MSLRDDWAKTWLRAYMWRCEDAVCDCWQPVIERLMPNLVTGYPWVKRQRVWEGPFVSEPTATEIKALELILLENALVRGIVLDKYNQGRIEEVRDDAWAV